MFIIPKIWREADVYIIGGGFSIAEQFQIPTDIVHAVQSKELPLNAFSPYLSFLHDKHVIGINAAYKLGKWIDITFFGDEKFFLQNRKQLANHPSLKITCHPRFEKDFKGMAKYMCKDPRKIRGISEKPGYVCWNANSGAAAISVAVQAGAKRIFLLGFDMTHLNGLKHFHSEYHEGAYMPPLDERQNPFIIHLQGFRQIALDAKISGTEIINVSPDSVVDAFKKVTLESVI